MQSSAQTVHHHIEKPRQIIEQIENWTGFRAGVCVMAVLQ